MQIIINISKTHARILASLLLILAVGIAADYASGAGLSQWHTLSEISADGVTSIESTTSPGKINASYIQGGVGQWTANGDNISNSNTGKVGIGTTSPNSKLSVSGNITITGADNGIIFPDGTVLKTKC